MHRSPCLPAIALGVLVCAAAASARAQEASVMRFDASTTVFVHELGAAVGVSEDDGTVRFLMVAPAEARQGAAAEVDVREDDVVVMAAGQRIRTIGDFRKVYEGAAVGSQLKLGLQRGDQRFLSSFVRAEPPKGGTTVTAGGGGVRMIRMVAPGQGEGVEIVPGLGVVLGESGGAVEVTTLLPLPSTPPSPFEEGDRLRRLAGREVVSLSGLMEVYEGIEVGSVITVTVERAGEALELEVTKRATPEGMVLRGPA